MILLTKKEIQLVFTMRDPVEAVRDADKIFFDSVEAVLAEAGDFIIPLSRKRISKDKFSGEIRENSRHI